MMRQLFALMLLGLFLGGGCARVNWNKARQYQTVSSGAVQDSEAAQRKHDLALDLIAQCKTQEAEECLHQALIEDVSFGPAHNSLGKLYFDQKKFYLAAWEFEHAIKTMPQRPEPHNNLGLVLESVGQLQLAIESYQIALELDEANPEYLGNYLRARYRESGFTEDLRGPFEELVLLEERESWRNWAKGVLSKNHPQYREVKHLQQSAPGGPTSFVPESESAPDMPQERAHSDFNDSFSLEPIVERNN